MHPSLKKARTFRQFLRERKGNLSLMAALLLPVGLGAAGLAMDAAYMIGSRSALQNAADAAALATASALASQSITISQANAFAVDYISAQMANQAKTMTEADKTLLRTSLTTCTNTTTLEKTTIGTAKQYNVTIKTCVDVKYSALSAFLGQNKGKVSVVAKTESTTESKNALSMYLVLDRSGSMSEYTNTVSGSYVCRYGRTSYTYTCYTYYDKITALRMAAGNLMDELASADPSTTLVRTAAVSYNAEMQTPVNLAWGENHTKNYIKALTATGGTDSSLAFKAAYQALSASSEDSLHAAKNGQVPTKYIVFMTDGDNNYTSADTATKQWCDKARQAGIEVYSVAFMAPDRGQALLSYCATTKAHYFDAQDADDLNSAFQYIGDKATQTATRLTQ